MSVRWLNPEYGAEGEARRDDWLFDSDPPDPDDADYQQEHAIQDALFEAGAYHTEEQS